MRYAVVSDIHANLQAWNAILTDIATQQTNRILCLGDIVGYGPNPAEVLESVYRHVDAFCMGNHDAAVCGKLDATLFNEHAQRLIEWTRNRLSEKAVRFLAAQPLTLTGPGFRCVHGDFTKPAAFQYIEDAASAAPCWTAVNERLLFAGHTHVAALFIIGDSGTTHHLAPQDFVVEANRRYLVNPGSAGNPRAGAALASYCIYDEAEGVVLWRRVPFDLDAYRNACRAAGFTDADTHFLNLDPRRQLQAVRETVSFSPARTPAEQAREVTPVAELARLSRHARRWKRLALTAGITSLLAVVVGFGIGLKRTDGPRMIPWREMASITPTSPDNMLPPFPDTTDGYALAGWRVRLDNPHTTLLVTEPGHAGFSVIVTVTGAPARFRIESPPVQLDKPRPDRFVLKSGMRKGSDFSGTALFAIEQLGEQTGNTYPVLVRETKDPPPRSPIIKFTTSSDRFSSETRFIRFAVEGEHSGSVTFTAPSMEPVSSVLLQDNPTRQ